MLGCLGKHEGAMCHNFSFSTTRHHLPIFSSGNIGLSVKCEALTFAAVEKSKTDLFSKKNNTGLAWAWKNIIQAHFTERLSKPFAVAMAQCDQASIKVNFSKKTQKFSFKKLVS